MEIKDNIFRRKFHAKELYDWFHDNFPDSFSISIHTGEVYKYKEEIWSIWKASDGKFGKRNWYKKFPTEYTLYDRPIFNVYSGDENTYISFIIEDDNSNYFIVSWGYKRYDVGEEDYAAALAELLFETCHTKHGTTVLGIDYCHVSLKAYYEKRKDSYQMPRV